MGGETTAPAEQTELVELLDDALAEVYHYLLRRVADRAVAEDLTSETMLAAFQMARRAAVTSISMAWLIGIARHKLVDHWRRQSAEQRRFAPRRAPASERLSSAWRRYGL